MTRLAQIKAELSMIKRERDLQNIAIHDLVCGAPARAGQSLEILITKTQVKNLRADADSSVRVGIGMCSARFHGTTGTRG